MFFRMKLLCHLHFKGFCVCFRLLLPFENYLNKIKELTASENDKDTDCTELSENEECSAQSAPKPNGNGTKSQGTENSPCKTTKTPNKRGRKAKGIRKSKLVKDQVVANSETMGMVEEIFQADEKQERQRSDDTPCRKEDVLGKQVDNKDDVIDREKDCAENEEEIVNLETDGMTLSFLPS